ncbi:sulfatase-like hydrolase/transferase [Verrucomicrobium spinosum]|uniref:sulfatase-like hydrolase/transferase n=1 Tax=Verrucomicrobium spinosum TaxID=2736 RepID=UPI000A962DCC
MEQHKDAPFFCYLPYNTPHSPWAVPQEYWQRFKDKPLALTAPDTVKEDLDETRCVLAMMENLDWNVGRVLAQIKKLGIEENTLVVYFSDNGPTRSAGMAA